MPPVLVKAKVKEDLEKTRKRLEYSFTKVRNQKFDHELEESELEVLESFSSRFARFSDLLISRYFRLLMLEKDPAFRGSLIDLLNQAEKHAWISSKETWLRIRELRNLAAHDYEAENYQALYQELIHLAPELLNVSIR